VSATDEYAAAVAPDAAPAPPGRVRFGPGDTQEIPLDWAEKGLCWLYEHRRQVFADMMLAVMDTGFQTGNARKNAANGYRHD
jgi:hypothetical protein